MKEEYKSFLITIEQDEYPSNPREWDNIGKMICFHKRYDLGDKHNYSSENYSSWDEMRKAIVKNENVAIILPLYLYDHSGLTMNTTGFSCPWDSGQVGFIYVSKEDIREQYNVKRINKALLERVKEVLISEVKEYDQYLTGDVYRFTIEDENGEVLDAIGGFYGFKYALDEARSTIDAHIEYERIKRQLELKKKIKSHVPLQYR